MTAPTVEIPARIRGYAEVLVTPGDGLAHTPGTYQHLIGTRQVWDAAEARMVDQDVFRADPYPACKDTPAPGDDVTVWQFSAGWAHHLGHAGCPVCWPDDTNGA